VRLRVTRAQARRCYGQLRAGGDVWAALIAVNEHRFRRRGRPILNYQEWCREIAGVAVGELSVPAARSVVRRYTDACMETARRKRRGDRARYPRRRRALFPLRWYSGTFTLQDRRLRLSVARGAAPLWVRLARPVPYSADAVRSVTLLVDGGRLCVDVTARVAVEDHGLEPARVAGVDVGIIHPFAAAAGDEALVISGRQLRAEERLHLVDTKARQRRMSPKQPRRGQRGSRRWRKLRAAQRRAEARHQRRIRHAHHHAAKELVAWAIARKVGTLVVGDLRGITARDVGRYQNLRLRQWRRTHLIGALTDKAALADIRLAFVDERGTSSTCPECRAPVAKPKGREFKCPHCGHHGHRDIVGARNIAARGGGTTTTPVVVTHRRVGQQPARRDRRRHLMEQRRSCPAPGRPTTTVAGSRSQAHQPPAPADTLTDAPERQPARINQHAAHAANVG